MTALKQQQMPHPVAAPHPSPAHVAEAVPMPAPVAAPMPAPVAAAPSRGAQIMPVAVPRPAQAEPLPQAAPMPQAMPQAMEQAAPMPQSIQDPMMAQMMPNMGSPMQMQPMMAQQMGQMQQQMNQMPMAQMAMGNMHGAMGHNQVDGAAREGGDKVLPQISIHVFCERQETAHCMNETTRDWRMKRVNMRIYMGGLSAAIDFYSKENTPGMIIIESGLTGSELFSQLEQLASVCDEGTKVVMIGVSNDIRLYRQLIDKGVSDYIVPPLYPLNVIHSLGELYSDPESPFIGRAIAFFGAKGGVGSSTLAHNIAWCLSERLMHETALVDMDSSWGTTGLDFAYDSVSGLEEALAEPERLDETLLDRIMIRHTQKLSILPTSGSLHLKPVSDTAAYEAVVDGVRNISPLSILDMPHQWSDWTTNILSTVDDIVITATPDLANLRNTKNLIDYLKAQRPNDGDPIFILNKTGMSKNYEISVKDFSSAVGLEPSLVIGFDPDSFFEVVNEGKMLADVKSAAQTVEGLEYIANRLKTGKFEMRIANSGSKSKKEGKSRFPFKKKKG